MKSHRGKLAGDAGIFAALLIAMSAAIACAPRESSAGAMSALAQCTGPQQITLSWDWWENPSIPTGRPEWVGYDVMRRALSPCTAFARINADIVPRSVGASHSRTYADNSIATFQTYEYKAVPVDVDRNPVIMLAPDCEPPCAPPAYASCPASSAPLTVGRLEDFGWAIFAMPCPNSCYSTFYFSGPVVGTLRAQGLIGTTQKLFGPGACCGIEGGSMQVVYWEPGDCGAVPARRTSWGELKTIYR